MTWSKLSDDFSDDCWTLSDQAFRLHVDGLVWSNRKLLDCRIPKDDVRRFAKHPEAITELMDVGFWTAEGDSYVIRHHARYQRLREAVVNQQAANERNGKKGGRPKREQVADLNQETEPVNESVSGSETKRDRTGQVKGRPIGREFSETKHDFDQPADDQASVSTDPVPIGGDPRETSSKWIERCDVCNEPMDDYEIGQTSHPTCTRSATVGQRWSA